MAGVFLSYDREDGAQARTLALALEKAGHSVWWDLHVRGGAQFSKVIEEALKAADVVVVLWSANSIESAWVRDEAAAGRDSGRLIPATIDGTEAPLGFRQFQTIDLRDWKRGARGRGYKELQQAIEETGGMPTLVPGRILPKNKAPSPSWMSRWLLSLPIAGAIAVAAYLAWPPTSSAIPTVAVEPASGSSTAQALARDLFAKLGSLQSSNAKALQLVEQGSGRDPDLVFKVDGTNDAVGTRASLLLLGRRSHELLWSSDFQQAANRQSDLRQQLAYSAAGVLDCASEAFNASGKKLDSQTRRLYLNGCGSFASVGSDANTLVPLFRNITRRAPRFEDGWRKLIYVEDVSLFAPPSTGSDPQKRAQLQRDIVHARRINPEMPEAYVAEGDLVPQDQFAERMRLNDLAATKNPDSASALAARSYALQQVGRMNEAVLDARRAVNLSPFSPVTQDAYISALTYAGQFDSATEELRKAEALWPGATYIADAWYRLNLRYGAPEAALKQVQGRQINMPFGALHAIYLKARMEPTRANVDEAVEAALRRYQSNPVMASDYIQTLATFGRTEEVYEFLLKWQRRDLIRFVTDVLFRPQFKSFWSDPRSLQAAAHLGLLSYWRTADQWPDFCNDPQLPYDCKKEAAKLGA
jgi:tetratricopeptide (TPR) repeat protein